MLFNARSASHDVVTAVSNGMKPALELAQSARQAFETLRDALWDIDCNLENRSNEPLIAALRSKARGALIEVEALPCDAFLGAYASPCLNTATHLNDEGDPSCDECEQEGDH